jgi:dGTPase
MDAAPTPWSREHREASGSDMPPLALDRQRIVHSAAFRRLGYKTQVFLALTEDHFRTRLTHTLEVADLARRIASAMGLNAELAEAVALAHDLGHAPFGHAGERALNECAREQGGFEHNLQSLRIVEYLEHPYPEFRGLNLTRAVRECLAKHSTRYDRPGPHALQDGRPPPPEGQVADLADRLAYALHDLQDGLYAGLLAHDALGTLDLWQRAGGTLAHGPEQAWRRHLRPIIDRIQQLLVQDVVAASRHHGGAARLSSGMEGSLDQLDAFLLERLYRHHQVLRMDHKAYRLVTEVFAAYVADPHLLPPRFLKRVPQEGVQRVSVDFIAGMTDRYCLREHGRLFDPRVDL